MDVLTLEQAVAGHVRPGDRVHVAMGHHRWTALARELARQFWGADPGFELVMASLGSLGALFFRGGLVRRVLTAYSGDSFPTYSPNPVFAAAYASGAVEVEHWSFLSLVQRLQAAALGLPAIATRSLTGSSMAQNPAFHECDTPAGRVGLLEPLVPDVTLMHAAVADREGNVAVAPPALEGVWGAFAARRGVLVSVERIVDDLRPWQSFVQIPAHRVLAAVEAPYGAHPGGLYAGVLPVQGYGEDIPFWVEARRAARGDFDAWAREWCLEPATHEAYLARLGPDRLARLGRRADPDSWRDDEAAYPADLGAPVSDWERAAVWAARALGERASDLRADAVLAGAGVANLAAWLAAERCREAGRPLRLTAELGLWDYRPTRADPYIFNLRAFPTSALLADASTVLGLLVGGPGTTTIGCVGAAQVDAQGCVNSTVIPGQAFLVGSGGGNDVVSLAAESLVVTLLRPDRTPERVGYVTAPGDRVRTVVTDLGVLARATAGEPLRLAAVPAGASPLDERIRTAVSRCGWPLDVAREVAELPAPSPAELQILRRYDPRREFLRGAGEGVPAVTTNHSLLGSLGEVPA